MTQVIVKSQKMGAKILHTMKLLRNWYKNEEIVGIVGYAKGYCHEIYHR